ncbi:MAG: DUF4139 domain-containing protein [Phycisphaerales bacterium]
MPARFSRLTAAAALAFVAMFAPRAWAQDPEPQVVSDAGRIERVVLYPRGAAVTRAIRRDLPQGLWTVRVTGLPAGVDPAQVQARVRAAAGSSGEAPRLLAVEYEEAPGIDFAGSPEGVELATKLKDAKRRQAEAAQDRAQLEQRAARIDQVGVRAAANATAEGGTATADPARALEQVGWVRSQRAKLLDESRALAERTDAIGREVAALEAAVAQRGRADRTQRTSVVRLAAPSACALELDLTYVVDRAGWAPAYAIRAAADRSGTSVEYDAVLAQHSGEDWTDARITLSTARPDASAAPGDVVPVYVDVAPPMVAGLADWYGRVASVSAKDNRMRRPGKPRGPGGGGGGSSGDPDAAVVPADDAGRADALEAMAGGASVAESGIAATFELPRRVSVPSDAARTQRTRIATLEPSVAFVHVAHPLMTEEVFVRGDLVNDSGYQLLPGTAQVFFGGDLVGDAAVPAVAPKAPFTVFFGADRTVRARREVVSKLLGTAGLFGGSSACTWKYRITLDNGSGRALRVEVIDRRPASRNEKIEVKVADLSAPLSTDAEYLAGPQKSGILRWDLAVPATARGPAATTLTWTVQETHPKDVQTTAMPD